MVKALRYDANPKRTTGHDLESWALVLAHTILRKLRATVQYNSADADPVEKVFHSAFGYHSIDGILDIRGNLGATDWARSESLGPILREHIPPALWILILQIDGELDRVRFTNSQVQRRITMEQIPEPEPAAQSERNETLTYEFLVARFDEAVARLTPQSKY